MFLRRRGKGWIVLLLLITVSANAASTIADCSSNCIYSASQDADMHPFFIPETNRIAVSCDSRLAGVAAEFLKPPVSFIDSPQSSPSHAKSLPAVPAASFMVLIGFICISLVKDRRVWMAALTGLLWAGQTGIGAILQLALRLSRANIGNKQSSAEVYYSNYFLNFERPRSDIKGTQYIGLLHHLAGIPDSANSFQYQSAFLLERYGSNSLLVCLVLKAKQLICFSPAFIFCRLPHGPPIQT